MHDPVIELKARANILHARIRRGDVRAIERLRILPPFGVTTTAEDLAAFVPQLQHREVLSVLAIECGFKGWQHAASLFNGVAGVDDFGTILYPKAVGGHMNTWYRIYDDAAAHRVERGGFLLVFRREFFVAEAPFVASLGLDPSAPEWERMGYDWARPHDLEARTHLYGVLISLRPREDAGG